MFLSHTVPKILSLISRNLKRSRDSVLIPFCGLWQSIIHALGHLCVSQHTAYEVPSFTDSKDVTWKQNLRKRVTWPWPRPLRGCLSSQC